MNLYTKRMSSRIGGAISVLLSTLIFASCTPISPWSFPLAGGPTPPSAVAPFTAPSSASADFTSAATPSLPEATPTLTAQAVAPPTPVAAAPSRAIAGLGGLADAATITSTAAVTENTGLTNTAALSQTPPTAAQAVAIPRPVPPITPISMDAAAECLAQGAVVYGLALQNTNVRQDASTSACRIGRIPRGALVRINGVIGAPSASTTSTPTIAATLPTSAQPLGYNEDVLPILQRNCNSCHSAVAKIQELQVTSYAGIMQGSVSGPVVLPGDASGSLLWQMVSTGKMPLIGSLTSSEKNRIKDWIDGGALESRPTTTATQPESPATNATNPLWLEVEPGDINPVSDACAAPLAMPQHVVSSQLILPLVCGAEPNPVAVELLRAQVGLPTATNPTGIAGAAVTAPAATVAAAADTPLTTTVANTTAVDATGSPSDASTDSSTDAASIAAAAPQAPAFAAAAAAGTGITAPALGLSAPSDSDAWLTPRGGLCIERKLPNNDRGITALAFAPDGRLFLAFDAKLTGQDVDQIILYDAFHPSRSIGVIDSTSMQGLSEILNESPRITGLDWQDGALYISRAGEVGRIVDGGAYETLASGFAVSSQLFHANDGLVISNGWLYVSAGGVRDGYSDGPIVGIDEAAAQQIVSGGNPYAARIVRAPLDALLSQRSIDAFTTAARGTRNPYGITATSDGRIWFTDNGATNVPEGVSAGDEVDMLDPATIGGDEASTPYYGFPLAITQPNESYVHPAVVLPNTSAPTGITWALGTIYYAQYGKDPGLYRIGVGAGGVLVSERVMLGWPILAVTTAPDGALWVGMGDGSLFRMTAGCQ